MSNVTDIKDFSTRRAVERSRGLWRKHFPEEWTNRTRLADLSDQTLLKLARLGEDMTTVLYGLTMSVLGLGSEVKFQYLRGEPKIRVLDANLFLIDQIRWECMRRLGWVHGFAAEQYPIVDLIMDGRRIKAEFSPKYPEINDGHPSWEAFHSHGGIDGEAVLRGLIPAALAAFGQRA